MWKTGEFGGVLSKIRQILDLFVVPRRSHPDYAPMTPPFRFSISLKALQGFLAWLIASKDCTWLCVAK